MMYSAAPANSADESAARNWRKGIKANHLAQVLKPALMGAYRASAHAYPNIMAGFETSHIVREDIHEYGQVALLLKEIALVDHP